MATKVRNNMFAVTPHWSSPTGMDQECAFDAGWNQHLVCCSMFTCRFFFRLGCGARVCLYCCWLGHQQNATDSATLSYGTWCLAVWHSVAVISCSREGTPSQAPGGVPQLEVEMPWRQVRSKVCLFGRVWHGVCCCSKLCISGDEFSRASLETAWCRS